MTIRVILFQSTRPVWGATVVSVVVVQRAIDFNPRAPCGARPSTRAESAVIIFNFNPRAPCGARRYSANHASSCALFQSTRPVWGATSISVCTNCVIIISIHAPRVGRDRSRRIHLRSEQYFNPRAPCGARLTFGDEAQLRSQFQSTRPVWGATLIEAVIFNDITISIHAPRVGRDHTTKTRTQERSYFNPRAPCGARRQKASSCNTDENFNPRAPCGARQRGAGEK